MDLLSRSGSLHISTERLRRHFDLEVPAEPPSCADRAALPFHLTTGRPFSLRSLLPILFFAATALCSYPAEGQPTSRKNSFRADNCVEIMLSRLTFAGSLMAVYTRTVRNVCGTPIDFYYCRGRDCGSGNGYYRDVVTITGWSETTLRFVYQKLDAMKDPTLVKTLHYMACVSHGPTPSSRHTEAGVCPPPVKTRFRFQDRRIHKWKVD